MNVRSIPGACIAMVALAAAPLDADADTWRHYSGHECHPLNEDRAVVDPWSEGCVNESETCGDSATVSLPLSGRNDFDINLQTAVAYYYDGSTLGSVECAVVLSIFNSGYYVSTYQNSGAAFTGGGAFIWTDAALPNGGNNTGNVGNAYITCSLPAKKQPGACTAQSVSMVRSYAISTVNP